MSGMYRRDKGCVWSGNGFFFYLLNNVVSTPSLQTVALGRQDVAKILADPAALELRHWLKMTRFRNPEEHFFSSLASAGFFGKKGKIYLDDSKKKAAAAAAATTTITTLYTTKPTAVTATKSTNSSLTTATATTTATTTTSLLQQQQTRNTTTATTTTTTTTTAVYFYNNYYNNSNGTSSNSGDDNSKGNAINVSSLRQCG